MMGCIPVICETDSKKAYSQLFKGVVFEEHPIEDIIVVVNDKLFFSPDLMKYLANFTDDEIKLRRSRMRYSIINKCSAKL